LTHLPSLALLLLLLHFPFTKLIGKRSSYSHDRTAFTTR
jgi:hypothetical protein